jgi:hypothetical protein
MSIRCRKVVWCLILAGCALLMITACSQTPSIPTAPADEPDKSFSFVRQPDDVFPAERATLLVAGTPVVFWPYTGAGFDGTPVDPLNLVFTGQADPLRIRAALMALDGDRSAFGIPPVPPFNARWTDAIGGDVQTACAVGGDGWVGSVVQLTLGEFGPLRVHLRLFRTGQRPGGAAVTLGGAHFEVQIPGTADHQVLSWELAEQIVTADLVRSGLLGAAPASTGPLNATPSFRTIMKEVYNGLPPELVGLIGGPAQPVTADVPLPSDGQGTLLRLAGAARLVPGHWDQSVTVNYDQLVPRPFCADGPGDFLMVTGPVTFTARSSLLPGGLFVSLTSFVGNIEAVPVDLSSGTPVVVGAAFPARVSGNSSVVMNAWSARVIMQDRRFTHEADGNQVKQIWMNIPQQGPKSCWVALRCLDDE